MKLIEQNSYDGIDVNLEDISDDSLTEFYPFLTRLSEELDRNNVLFSITIHVEKNSKELELLSDHVRLVFYDYNHPLHDPKPVLSKDQFTVLLKQISIKKNIIVLPIHGYEWNSSTITPISYLEAINEITGSKGSWERDPASYEMKGYYERAGIIRTIWIEDSESIYEKIQIGKTQGFQQFSFWYIGEEDSKLWNIIRSAE